MRFFKRLCVVLLLVVVLVYGVLLAINNEALAPLDMLFIQFSDQRVILWVFLAFAIGGIVGLLISAAAIVRLKSKVMMLQRKLGNTDKALEKIRKTEFSTPISKQ